MEFLFCNDMSDTRKSGDIVESRVDMYIYIYINYLLPVIIHLPPFISYLKITLKVCIYIHTYNIYNIKYIYVGLF